MLLKTKEAIDIIRQSADILSRVHGHMARAIEPGIATEEIDKIAESYIRRCGAQPSFKGFEGFPNTICISINDEVVHVPPSKKKIKDGDIVTIDCGVYYKGFHTDSAFTHAVGILPKETLHLLRVTEEALYKGISNARVGNHIVDIGSAIQEHVEKHGFTIVKGYGGHGIGSSLHESPIIYNYKRRRKGLPIQEGMVLAIEPIVNMGNGAVYSADAHSVLTRDGKLSCHFEHTIAIVDGLPEVLTSFQYIKDAKT